MKVLFVASEANPFAASGGLGDVMGALPAALRERSGGACEADVILPLYGSMKEEYRRRMTKVADISFRLSWRNTGASVFRIDAGAVGYYFIENHYYFDRGALYGEKDDGERFAFFSMAVLEFMKQTGYTPDILHANDWQSALTVIYLKTLYASDPVLSSVRTVYTIHNIEYQGKFDPFALGDIFALDTKYESIVRFDGCINLMKGALTVSDYISTVSPSYAAELTTDFFAFGLSSVIRDVSHKMRGIINGIDYETFGPENGRDIVAAFDASSVKEGKGANKRALQAELGLAVNADIPMVVMITRLATAKGIDLVLCILEELLCEPLQFVLLGTGEAEYEAAFRAMEAKHPNFRALIKFDRATSKRMYASADLFLMPSRSEPCGLAQMIACSYGTVPIVRSVGGLKDSIVPYGTEGSCGFRFDNYNAHELLFTVKDALAVYRDEQAWDALVARAKAQDFTWSASAGEYLRMYRELLHR